jgi:hypothetical protein
VTVSTDTVAGQHEDKPFLDWLRNRFPVPPRCPLCGADEWGAGDEVALMPLRGTDGPPMAFAARMLTCTSCGYVILINPHVAGIGDDAGPASEG